MNIEKFGSFVPDGHGWLEGNKRFMIPALEQECRFVLEGFEDDEAQSEFIDAMINFMDLDREVLVKAQGYVYEYYSKVLESGWGNPPAIPSENEVWDFVRFGTEAFVSRRSYGDKAVYISLENGCAWEQEHGLQLVFKDGGIITKVGPFDGHLNHADAYDDASLEGFVFVE